MYKEGVVVFVCVLPYKKNCGESGIQSQIRTSLSEIIHLCKKKQQQLHLRKQQEPITHSGRLRHRD